LSARPGAYPAETAEAEHLAGENWLAVGDAAMSFDPLSSQGLASAILMGAKAGEAIAGPNRDGAIAAWAEDYRMLFAEHADLRTYYARLERRWPHAVFWRRRQEPDNTATRPREVASDEIPLAELHVIAPQNVVGRGDMEKEAREKD
jgi:flavin-dependent dehydrogenase